jgi:hypothetical protein
MKRASRVCGQSSPAKVDYSMAMRLTSALYEDTQHEQTTSFVLQINALTPQPLAGGH